MAFQAVPGVDDGDLIRTTWGDAVSNDITNELIRRGNGAIAMTGDLVLRNANPTATGHAVRKKYVDDNFMGTTGGTINGQLDVNAQATSDVLVVRSQVTAGGGALVNTPQISLYSNTEAVRYGYVQGSSAGLLLASAAGDVTLTAGGGQIYCSDQVRCLAAMFGTGASRFFASGATLSLAGPSNTTYLSFHGAASNVDSIGGRSGYVGYTGDSALRLENQAASGSIYFTTDFAVVFDVAGTERMRLSQATLLVGKTTTAISTEGTAISHNGTMHTTFTGGAVGDDANVKCNRLGSVDGELFVEFLRNGSRVGRIEQTGTTGAALVSGSDYRMKTVVGPIDNAVDRIKALKPYRVTWNGDPGRGETDAFLAHEVQPYVPEAVSGEKDAVTGPPATEDDPPEGTPIMQGMSYDKLITVTIAALQDALAEIDVLKERVTELEARVSDDDGYMDDDEGDEDDDGSDDSD